MLVLLFALMLLMEDPSAAVTCGVTTAPTEKGQI